MILQCLAQDGGHCQHDTAVPGAGWWSLPAHSVKEISEHETKVFVLSVLSRLVHMYVIIGTH
jgi:hypothetical protein